MKRFYSIILLASFLVGVIQPILPMVEYHLFEGDVRDLTKETFALCTVSLCENPDTQQASDIPFACDRTEDPTNPDLLDVEYYPIPVQAFATPYRMMLPDRGMLESGYLVEVAEPFLFRDYPPPRRV